MLTFGIRYLTGCVVASDVGDRSRAEWPPHPGRTFMALAAAHFQTGDDPAERAALEWLEEYCEKHPPEIYAPSHVERPVVTHYVPVNDKAGPSKAPLQSVLGLTRPRQPRTFARAWLETDTAYLSWPDARPDGHFAALANLCEKVTRIGHSISLVQMWASQEPPLQRVNWVPDDLHESERFRVPGPGVLRNLERQFNRESVNQYFELSEAASDASDKKRQREAKEALKAQFRNTPPPRLRPNLSFSHGYAQRREEPDVSAISTVFDPRLLVFPLQREDGPVRHLDLVATLQLTSRLREAVLAQLGSSAPEVLTGHAASGRSERPHIAFIPVPFVGSEHAHGGILGIGVAVPREIDADVRRFLLRALQGIRDGIRPDGALVPENERGLKLGRLGRWSFGVIDSASPVNLRERLWTAAPRGARQWATVTPYVYDRHPKAKDKGAYQQELADSVRTSWERVRQLHQTDSKLEVVITPVSAHLGVPPSHCYPRMTRKDGGECRHSHAILVFERPVVGPLLLGAGRYRGYGLCRPLSEEV